MRIMRKYLSEATRENEIEYGEFNSIMAPVGSGKTTYVGITLPQELDYEGLYIYLAPYTMLEQQVIEEELFVKATADQKREWEGSIIFQPENPDHLALTEGKVAMTTHAFMKLIRDYPEFSEKIGVIVIDEVDHVLCNLPRWELKNPNSLFRNVKEVFEKLITIDAVRVVGITATGEEKLREMWSPIYNEITFAEELIRLEPAATETYDDLRLAFNDAIAKGKTAIYTQSVRNMLKQKEYLESMGRTVHMITSDYAKNYKMSDTERQIKSDLATTGRSDLIEDVLLFNAAMERGVSIHDTLFKSIIIHSSVADVITQVVGRFRFNGMNVWTLKSEEERIRMDRIDTMKDSTGAITTEIVIPAKYMGIPLTTDMKNELIAEIGFSRKWTSLKNTIIDLDYAVKDHTKNIDGKRVRVSTITK